MHVPNTPPTLRSARRIIITAVVLMCALLLSACSAKPQTGNERNGRDDEGLALEYYSTQAQTAPQEPLFPAEVGPETVLTVELMCPTSQEVVEATLEEALAFYVECHSGTYGVYIHDLTTDLTYGYNADRTFRAASTAKLPLALYVLKLIDEGQASLTDRIFYEDELDWETGTGSLQAWVQPGVSLTLEDLIDLSITESDNIAKNMLLRHFGQENLLAWMQEVGGIGAIWEEDSLATTPREMALYMYMAATPETWQQPELGQWLIELLTQTIFPVRTEAGVPAGVPVAHKVGSWPGVVNDIGLVLGDHPFIISLFSDGVMDHDVADEVLAGITTLAYRYLNEVAR